MKKENDRKEYEMVQITPTRRIPGAILLPFYSRPALLLLAFCPHPARVLPSSYSRPALLLLAFCPHPARVLPSSCSRPALILLASCPHPLRHSRKARGAIGSRKLGRGNSRSVRFQADSRLPAPCRGAHLLPIRLGIVNEYRQTTAPEERRHQGIQGSGTSSFCFAAAGWPKGTAAGADSDPPRQTTRSTARHSAPAIIK
jgi:hypothetical protein